MNNNQIAGADWPKIWAVVEGQFRGDVDGIHGRRHWRQVERNAIMLAECAELDADAIVTVRLFAALHDSQRVNDDWDKGHGARAAAFAARQRGVLFDLPDPLMKKLMGACERHELGEVTADLLMGVCWDADRLDLVRIGAAPRDALMNTAEGKRLARVGWNGRMQ